MNPVAMVKTLLKAGVLYGISNFILKGEHTKAHMKKIMTGIVMVLLSVFLAYLGLIALVGSFFFLLAEFPDLSRSALITGILVLVIAGILIAEGYRSISK